VTIDFAPGFEVLAFVDRAKVVVKTEPDLKQVKGKFF